MLLQDMVMARGDFVSGGADQSHNQVIKVDSGAYGNKKR